MDANNIFKNHAYEKNLFIARCTTAVLISFIFIFILLARCFHLQVLSYNNYNTMSDNNRVTVIPLPPLRGKIFDKNGVVLAENQASFAIHLTPYYIKDIDNTIAELQELINLSQNMIISFKKRLRYSHAKKSIPLKFKLTEEEIAKFSVKQHIFDGVNIETTFIRKYPMYKTGAHVLGYVARISDKDLKRVDNSNYAGTNFIGKTGIEKFYEDTLHGTVGYRQVETDAKGNIIRVLKEKSPINGKDIYLSIDSRLQEMVQQSISKYRGAAIVACPETGKILAMASSPSFDPNIFANGVDSKTYAKLNDPKQKPLFNRAIQGQYSPASIIKPIVALAGLETEIIKADTSIHDPGWYKLRTDNHLYRDWKKVGHGWVNLEKAIVESCDTYFYKLADNLGIDNLTHWYNKFGLGDKTGIDLDNEAKGLVPSREWKKKVKNEPWYRGETIIAGIGQGFLLTTPIQLSQMTNAFATNGYLARPYLIEKIHDKQTNNEMYIAPNNISVEIKKDKNWNLISDSMRKSVHTVRGTAYNRIGRHIKFTMAGKTGTSQVYSIKQNESYNKYKIPEHLRDHTIFIGFAPYKSPEISVTVLIENNPGAAVICREISNYYMNEIKIKKRSKT